MMTSPPVATLSRLAAFFCTAVMLAQAACTSGDARAAALVPGYSDDIRAYDSREIAMLPRYCIYTQDFRDRVPGGNDAAEISRWTMTMGDIFNAMHHYCQGLMKKNRGELLARDPQVRAFYLKDSITEFDYVIQRAPKDFVLMPEILTKKGDNLMRLGSARLGIVELERAIELKPDYWPAYAVLGDYYRDQGDIAKAREILTKAAAVAPDAQAIRRRLTELDTVKPKQKSKGTAQ